MVVRHQGRAAWLASATDRLGGEETLHPRDDDTIPRTLTVHTPAKLNLFLDVLGKRPDGYHSLETIMVAVGLYDTLVFTDDNSHDTQLNVRECGSPARPCPPINQNFPDGADNLVSRAVRLLRGHAHCNRGVTITLLKRIPMQAGMGGGSSDAAATLVGLNRLWNLDLPSTTLHELAAQLGSDVNFFLDSPIAALCRGRGEIVEPFRLPQRLHAVIVCPPTGLSTTDVFSSLPAPTASDSDERTPTAQKFISHLQSGRYWGNDGASLFNALEVAAARLSHDVADTLMTLRSIHRGPVSMSGSGTSCFALCRTSHEARRLSNRLRQTMRGRVLAVNSQI